MKTRWRLQGQPKWANMYIHIMSYAPNWPALITTSLFEKGSKAALIWHLTEHERAMWERRPRTQPGGRYSVYFASRAKPI